MPVGECSLSRDLAGIPRFIEVPTGWLEVPASPESSAELAPLDRPKGFGAVEAWLGRNITVAIGLVVAMVGAVALGFWVGVPLAAKKVAFAVPARVEINAGASSLATLLKYLHAAPTLPAYEGRLRLALARLARGGGPFHIEPTFIILNVAPPNAFALPGGTIIVTYGLMRLNLTDEELAAVLAHEMGHEELRHGLQSTYRQSTALVLLTLATGDMSTLNRFAGSLPLVLVNRGYSRAFEREADEYAVELLHKCHLPPESLADALVKIDTAHGKAARPNEFSYLSTHPATFERVATIRALAATKR